MFFKDSIDNNSLHSIDEIAFNKIDAGQLVQMIIHAQEASRFGVSEDKILENIGAIRVCLFKDVNSEELLLNPDLIEVIVDYTHEGENGELVYDEFRKIVSFTEFRMALKERGFDLGVKSIAEVIPLLDEEEAEIKVIKAEKSKKLVRM